MIPELSIFEIIVLACFGLCFVVQITYYIGVFGKVYRTLIQQTKAREEYPEDLPPVSVIAFVDNKKSVDLEAFLETLLSQDYPEFEVIVVKDGFSKEDEDIFMNYRVSHPNFYFTSIPEGSRNLSRKKLTLTLGIKAAKYDCLLFTESDGIPRSDRWITRMAQHFANGKTIVLGMIFKTKCAGLLSHYAGYDLFWMQMKLASYSLLKKPYAANGRNLAYHKDFFFQRNTFSKYSNLEVGEDDLFVKEVATRDNTAVELTPDSHIWVDMETWKDYFIYKVDRSFTKKFYHRAPVRFWRLETFTRLLFYLFVIACCLLYSQHILFPIIAGALWLLRYLVQVIVFRKLTSSLEIPAYYLSIILFDIVQPFVNLHVDTYRRRFESDKYTTRK